MHVRRAKYSPPSRIIDGLPKALQNILVRLEEQTGFKSMLLVGGPRPDTGALMALW